ncbi:MAG: hypothetical protein ACTSSE_06600 [Candidatus Thorarchaeota archaeon]
MTDVIQNSPEQNLSGLRIVVAAFGILSGLTGMIAGIFEILQGNVAPSSFEISSIGSTYSMADDFTYHATTLIPNFLVTGILAFIVSFTVMIWSVKFVERKYGVFTLFILCISQVLVGGAWVIDIAIIMCLLATRINKPLNWWRSHLIGRTRDWFAKLFPLSLVCYAIISGAMLVFTIFGVNSSILIDVLSLLATAMFIV